MAQLAIKGHSMRGSEVIEILEMLGGENEYKLRGNNEECAYFEKNGVIYYNTSPIGFNNIKLFTLEEFLEKFPYKVGDKVMTDDGDKANIVGMVWDNDIDDVFYEVQIDTETVKYPKELLQPYKEETMETITINDFKANTKEWLIDKLGNMSIKDALQTISNIYNELHEPQYPKNYEECCKILKIEYQYFKTEEDGVSASTYKNKLFGSLKQLLICRDAYWKIAGEQMGLDKPWEPDWLNVEQDKYVLFTHNNAICSNRYVLGHNVLAFPTEKMRDAFYENFKELIENCKELL